MNWRITVLQTVALPLGYVAVFGTRVLYHGAAVLSMDFEKLFLFGVVLGYAIAKNKLLVSRLVIQINVFKQFGIF